MIVKCISDNGEKQCPMIMTCLARLTDKSITGCGIPLWYCGMIPQSAIMVEHSIRTGGGAENVDG